jgi:3-deoxy-D-manno-octulosonic-acid transferase
MADFSMRYIYNLIFYIALPFILLRLLWKARKSSAYCKRWHERLALKMKTPPLSNSIWVHAVSLGESIAAAPLIKSLMARYPNTNVVVTTMTLSGSEYIKKIFADSVLHTYVPYDYSGAVKRFLNHINPKLLVIMETELWPNILHYCAVRHTPVLLANARLSKHSMKGYMRLPRLTQSMLNDISMIAAQSQLDAQRFISLGATPKQVRVVGNIKFDITIAEDLPSRAQQLRQKWGGNRPIWIASSTHAGEETKVLQAYTIIKRVISNSLLILVPRHTERCAQIIALCEQQGFNVVSHKQGIPCSENTDIVIGDTMGELLLLYAASDIAFVGGSLEPSLGGHNLLEPAALNIPVITGPYVSNFIEVNSLLTDAGALIRINDATELANSVMQLFQNSSLRKKHSAAGLKVVQQNKGALQKLLSWIEDNL